MYIRNNEHKFVFIKTIRLLALNFYEAIVNIYLYISLNSVHDKHTHALVESLSNCILRKIL